jgi:DNA-nicking Smr family endonuclease
MTEHRPPGRRRFLTDHEIDLWLQVASSVTRLPGSIMPERSAPKAAETPAAPAVEKSRPTLPPYIPPQSAPRSGPLPLAPIERKLKQRIIRGRTEIEGAIDLHGMRQAEAQAALIGFLARAQAQGQKLVLVVTGKGKSGMVDETGFAREPGILRRVVPLWLHALELRGIVLGFEEAAAPHGGTGAIYVRLRRGGRPARGEP